MQQCKPTTGSFKNTTAPEILTFEEIQWYHSCYCYYCAWDEKFVKVKKHNLY